LNAGHALLLEIKQRELDFFRISSLFLDVLENSVFGSSIAYCSNVVTVRPEFSSPELVLDRRDFEAWTSCDLLDHADDLPSRVPGKELAEDVNVVLIESELVDVNGEAFPEPAEGIFDAIDDFLFKNRFSVFDRELDVVMTLRDIVVPTPEVSVDLRHMEALYVV